MPLGLSDGAKGAFRVGRFVANPAGAVGARPDGSGRAGDLLHLGVRDFRSEGGLLFLADGDLLTDRDEPRAFRVSQLGYLLGAGIGSDSLALQVDREEFLPVDRRGMGYKYWDLRATLPLAASPALSLAVSAGWLFKNDGTPARSDLTGAAFLRYAAAGEASLLGGRLKLLVAADALTDEGRRRFSPAGLSLSAGAGAFYGGADLVLSREENFVLDGPGRGGAWLLALRFPFSS
jgi:hypothetical protein